MNMEEFLQPKEATVEPENEVVEEEDEEIVPEELDVQKAVVESLAADKAMMAERLAAMEKENGELRAKAGELEKGAAVIDELQREIAALKAKNDEQAAELAKMGDVLATNAEDGAANKMALLDRDLELPDRFPGETRDHVIEVIREAREKAEAEGRIRRAQLLEAVLVANESSGELEKRRRGLEKFFNDNANIISGPVMAELDRCGIAYKNGEEYLLPSEILKRTY